MARYFFDIRDGEYIHDTVGQEFDDLQAARVQAVVFSARLLTANPSKFWEGEEWQLEVRDDTGVILFILTFMATSSPHLPRKKLSGPGPDIART